jgi:hypothetical protein
MGQQLVKLLGHWKSILNQTSIIITFRPLRNFYYDKEKKAWIIDGEVANNEDDMGVAQTKKQKMAEPAPPPPLAPPRSGNQVKQPKYNEESSVGKAGAISNPFAYTPGVAPNDSVRKPVVRQKYVGQS